MKFADDVMQVGTTVGDGATLTLGVRVGNRALYRDLFPTGTVVAYCDRTTRRSPNAATTGGKREYGYGALTWGGNADGSADTIARNVKRSTNANNRVAWETSDLHVVYVAPLLDVMGPLLQPTFQTGGLTDGTTIDATHFGKTLNLDVAGGMATVNLTAIATLGHGFKCRVWGYNHASNVIRLTPSTGEIINEQAANAVFDVPPETLRTLEINDTRSRWCIW